MNYRVGLNNRNKSLSELVKLSTVNAVLKTCNFLLNALQRILFKKAKQPRRILVFRTGSLGDNICALPSIAAIKRYYAGAEVDILSNTGLSNLVSLEKILDPALYNQIIDYTNMDRKKLVRLLKDRNYDLVIQLPQTDSSFYRLVRDMIFFRFIAKSGWGWQFSTVHFFRQTQEKHLQFPNEIERLAAILLQNGIEVDQRVYPLNFTDDDRISVEKKIHSKNIDVRKRSIAVVVGAKRAQNRWPIENFKQVLHGLGDQFNYFIVGGPEDKVLSEPLNDVKGVYNFCGELTPMQSALLLSTCILTLTNDTGPMHLSYAVGTPLVALFSSRDFPGKWFPPKEKKYQAFRTPDVECSVCLSENCMNNICMKAIKPLSIIDAIHKQVSPGQANQKSVELGEEIKNK